MNEEVMVDFRNELLKRREVKIMINSDKNPGFDNVRDKIIAKFKAPCENVSVKSIRNNFGTNNFLIEAFIYDSKEALEMIEPKAKKPRAGVEG